MLNLTNEPGSATQKAQGVIDPPASVADQIQTQMSYYEGSPTTMQLEEIADSISAIAATWAKNAKIPSSGTLGIPVLIAVKWGLTEKLEAALLAKGFVVHRNKY